MGLDHLLNLARKRGASGGIRPASLKGRYALLMMSKCKLKKSVYICMVELMSFETTKEDKKAY